MKYWIDLGKTYGCGGEYNSIKDAKKEAMAYARGVYFGGAMSCSIKRIDDDEVIAYVSHHYYDTFGKYHAAKFDRV
jgi:hypothetical protein